MFVNVGLLYGAVYPFLNRPGWSLHLARLSYLPLLAGLWLLRARLNRGLLAYLSSSLLGLAFVCFSLAGNSIPGFITTEVLGQTGIALLNIFLWSTLGDMAALFEGPGKTFGAGLAVNVFAIAAGQWADGLLLKTGDRAPIATALTAVTALFLTLVLLPFLSASLNRDLIQRVTGDTSSNVAVRIDPLLRLPGAERLTPRETEIVTLIAAGYSHKQIADKLGISGNTLKTHLQNVYRKADVTGKSELLALMLESAGWSE